MDSLDFIMQVEQEGFDGDNSDHVSGLQDIIDTGMVWNLQGSWGRLAHAAIKAGVCSVGETENG